MDETGSLLESILRGVGGDWALHRIIWLADNGFSLPVTLMTPSGLLAGDTSRSDVFVSEIDDAIRRSIDEVERSSAEQPPSDPAGLAAFEGMSPGDFALVREQFEEGVMFMPDISFRRERAEKMRARIKELEREGTPPEDVPEDVKQWLLDRHRPFPAMTLTDVVWTAAAGPLVLPKPVRVLVGNVTAWWLGRAKRPDDRG